MELRIGIDDYEYTEIKNDAEKFRNKGMVIPYLYKVIELGTPLPKNGGWIPISEKLPEELKNVIVTDIETSLTYQSRYMGNGYWECDNGYCRNRIVAWMPLPAPYAQQEREDKG